MMYLRMPPRRGMSSRRRPNPRARAAARVRREVKYLDRLFPYQTAGQIITASTTQYPQLTANAVTASSPLVFSQNSPTPVGGGNTGGDSPSCIALSYIPQGVDIGQRVGRQVVNICVDINGIISPSQSNTAPVAAFLYPGPCRLVLVHDASSNAVAPVPAGSANSSAVFVNPNGTASGSIGAMTNMSQRDRFTILYDEVFSMGGYRADQVEEPVVPICLQVSREVMIPAAYSRCTYSNTGGGSYTTGALFLMALGVTTFPTVGTSNAYFFQGTVRIRYVDN